MGNVELMYSSIKMFKTVHYYSSILLIYVSKSNCCCKAPLDSYGNGAIEVNVIIIIIIIIINFSIMLNKPWFIFYHLSGDRRRTSRSYWGPFVRGSCVGCP